MAFEGYLCKCGTTIVPAKFIEMGTYKSTPNMRFEKKALRDANVLLHRVTAKNTKSIFGWQVPSIDETEKAELLNIFKNAYTIELQRKLTAKYWNMEDGEYKIVDVYLADIEYTVNYHTNNNIFYKPFQIDFVQY